MRTNKKNEFREREREVVRGGRGGGEEERSTCFFSLSLLSLSSLSHFTLFQLSSPPRGVVPRRHFAFSPRKMWGLAMRAPSMVSNWPRRGLHEESESDQWGLASLSASFSFFRSPCFFLSPPTISGCLSPAISASPAPPLSLFLCSNQLTTLPSTRIPVFSIASNRKNKNS